MGKKGFTKKKKRKEKKSSEFLKDDYRKIDRIKCWIPLILQN